MPHDMAKKPKKTKDAKKKRKEEVSRAVTLAVGSPSSHPLYLTWLKSQVSASSSVFTSLSEAFWRSQLSLR